MTQTDTDSKIGSKWWAGSYDSWIKQQGVPIFSDYYVQDVRKLERGWWDLRGCPGVILNLVGHWGVTEARVLEIPAAQTIPPFHMAVEEIIYVLEGNGLASVWAEGYPKVTFEFQKHSLFRIPANYYYELSNTRGNQPALTLHTSYLPMAMATNANPDFFFNNPYVDTSELYEADGSFYSAEAKAVRQRHVRMNEAANNAPRQQGSEERTGSETWYANFFPDLTVWDKLSASTTPGRLSYGGGIQFPNSAMRTGLLVLPSRRYRTAHRHGPGVTIVGVQEADGYVIMWPEGAKREDYVIAPWQEGSVFVPPNQWYHMHVNCGAVENRQLRIFPPQPLMNYTAVDFEKYIPFVDEEPWIRQLFEEEVVKRGLTSLMPPECYTNPNYKWDVDWLKEG